MIEFPEDYQKLSQFPKEDVVENKKQDIKYFLA